MPPEEALPGGLSLRELGIIRWWIESGAPHSLPATPAGTEETKAVEKAAAPPLLAKLHPVLVHFPIALLLFAAAFELLSILGWRDAPWSVIRWACLLGAVGALCAFGTGWIRGEPHPPERLAMHRWSALGVVVLALAAAVCALPGEETKGKRRLIGRLLLLLAAALIGWTSHVGGELVHGPLFP